MAAAPPILGQDGRFRIIENAMGVPGLHVAVNVFSPEVHQRLFQDRVFSTGVIPFVENQAGPALDQCILHPTLYPSPRVSGPWPDDWHRIINAVRDSGLFPQATIPDNAYALTYQTGSEFECHWDGRGKWGEYVISCSLGYPCTVTFQYAVGKSTKQVDKTKDWTYEPPVPPPDAYWTRSMTDDACRPFNRRLWQYSMTLPPNSIYVMSGPSRYDWRHGINVNQRNHPLPRHDSINPLLFPPWNIRKSRRAAIFRSTKVFSDVSLQLEYERAVMAGDTEEAQSLEQRVALANRKEFAAQDGFGRKYTREEIPNVEAEARQVLQILQDSGVHRLRFEPFEVQFVHGHDIRAVGDNLAAGGGVRLGGAGAGAGADTGGGMRLGGGRALRPPTATNREPPEVIVIDDSSDEEEEEVSAPSQGMRRTAEAAGMGSGVDDERARLREARLQRFGQQEASPRPNAESTETAAAETVSDATPSSPDTGLTSATTQAVTASGMVGNESASTAGGSSISTQPTAEERWGKEGKRTAAQERRWRARNMLWE